ncbi:DUF485 domain-containing protein [Actinoplanes regularis]|uniref:Uncharacterized membrane protein, DUF485 family n=1 Tax=Actinoplanes regularis TaxID=52697 RepID=A0A239B2C5_9ACTN|nr:DUF485 domain-containing protein [Actinoplanes regularis]GIE87233.1 membrane protein [Actinoplanes regularis]GLW29977.1 membrane protein [Actinoplanes regularis]SNS01353.1 Uncharacterized membrane protein, DUF485 family [Actinoplanes regularis]
MPATPERYLEVQNSDEFGRLRRTLRNFIFPTTIAFILWYALYVLLSAYARDFMAIKLVGNINIALVLGLLQFVSTFVIAWYYSRFAAQKIDPLADDIYNEIEGDRRPADTASTDGGVL